LDALDQVEVLKGSGSTMYGSDATAGVVNFLSKAPEQSEIRLRGGLGNWGSQQQRASIAYVRGPLAQQWTFSRDFSTGFAGNRDYRNLSAASTTAWKRTDLRLALNDRPFGADRFYGNFNSWERTKNWFAGLTQGFGEKTAVSFAYRRHTDLFVLYRDRPQVYTNRHIVEGYQAQVRRREDLPWNGRLHYGAEFLHDSIDSNNLGVHSRSRSAAYVSWDVRALQRFSFTVGAREEIYRNKQAQFNPTAAAGVWLHRRVKVRASVARAFRLPTYTDLYYRDPANVGNPLLRPETAWSYEGGVDWNAGGNWRGAVAVFQRRESNGIDYVRANPTDIWRATNFQSLRFTGIEANATTVLLRRHRVEVAYTGLSGAQAALGSLQSKYVFNYPRHAGLATWESSIGRGFLARTRLGAMERLGRNPYAVWDVFASYGKGPVRPYAQLTNLTSTRYEELAGIAMPGRGFIGGVEFVWTRSR
jgi:iron complex outermembrane receptor protein